MHRGFRVHLDFFPSFFFTVQGEGGGGLCFICHVEGGRERDDFYLFVYLFFIVEWLGIGGQWFF